MKGNLIATNEITRLNQFDIILNKFSSRRHTRNFVDYHVTCNDG